MKVPCSAPVCLLSSAGREGERERERSDFTFLPFSPCRCRETHVSTSLRAKGQEGQKGWDRYLEEEVEGLRQKEKRSKAKKEEEEGGLLPGGLGINSSTWARKQRLILWPVDRQINTPKQKPGLESERLYMPYSTNLGPTPHPRTVTPTQNISIGTLFFYLPLFCLLHSKQTFLQV